MYLVDDRVCDVIRKGGVHIKLNRSIWNLDNVRHVSNLRNNFISIRQFVKDGYVITFVSDVRNLQLLCSHALDRVGWM